MPLEHDQNWRIADQLGELYAGRQRGALLRAIAVVLMTPILLTLAIIVFVIMAPLGDRRTGDWLMSPAAPVTIPLGLLFGMFVAYFVSPKPKSLDWRWVIGSLVSYGLMVVLSQLPAEMRTAWFWATFTALGIVTLALLGRAYEPKVEYYLGWFGGYVDNPFTFRDDMDRRHVMLGFVIGFPTMLIGAWSDLFASGWLVTGLRPTDRRLCAQLLEDLGEDRAAAGSAALLAHGNRIAARVIRILAKLDLVRPSPNGLILTDRGAEVVARSRGLESGIC